MEVKFLKGQKYGDKPDFLIAIDIGYASTGIVIYNFVTQDITPITPNLQKFLQGFNTKNKGILEYILLSRKIIKFLINILFVQYSIQGNIIISLEIPNIIGCYAPALSILLNNLVLTFMKYSNTHSIYFTHNRLGAYYLGKRTQATAEVKQLMKEAFPDLKLVNEHVRDALMQVHTVLKLAYNITLSERLRSLRGSTIGELKL